MSTRPALSSSLVALIAIPSGCLLALICGAICIAIAFGGTAIGCGDNAPVGNVKGVPPKLVPIYRQAAGRYGLGSKGPAMLASINFNETSFGANMENTTGSGAEGWMMFMPETWATYGVDGNGDGAKDPFSPWDAIFAAARYLRASGAPGNWHDAIFAYNHAEWYVERIFGDFRRFQDTRLDGASTAETSCQAAAPTEAVAAMIAEAERLSAIRPRTEYVWGGSHSLSPTPPNGPFDCSSAVSHLLQVGGFNNPTMTTVGLSTWGMPGPGKWVTILVKPYDPEAHTVIEFMPGLTPPAERFWGTSGFVEPGHGPGMIPESTFDAGYLSRFELRHPPGM
jgi:hypothetical protein